MKSFLLDQVQGRHPSGSAQVVPGRPQPDLQAQ
jgi:hypothetical protein